MGPLSLPSALCDWDSSSRVLLAPWATSSAPSDILNSIFHALERRNLFVCAQGPALITNSKLSSYPVFFIFPEFSSGSPETLA